MQEEIKHYLCPLCHLGLRADKLLSHIENHPTERFIITYVTEGQNPLSKFYAMVDFEGVSLHLRSLLGKVIERAIYAAIKDDERVRAELDKMDRLAGKVHENT